MKDNELRARLQRIDPALAATNLVQPTDPRVQDRLERIMTTTLDTPETARPTPKRWLLPAFAGAAAAAIGIAVAASGGEPTKAPRTTLSLSAPAGGPTMNSCLQMTAEILRDVPVAFAGKATAVGAGSVTLAVSHWYKGGTATDVTITNPDTSLTSLDGVEFVKGDAYLITATEGTVNICGMSGPDTAELRALFDAAFPS